MQAIALFFCTLIALFIIGASWLEYEYKKLIGADTPDHCQRCNAYLPSGHCICDKQ